jgi:HEAT repeat protein
VQQQREKSIDRLMDLVDAEDKNVRAAVLQLTKQLQGAEVISNLLQKLKEADSDIKSEIIFILADRDEDEAYAAIISALQDQEKSVRLAAIPAAAKSGGNKSVPELLELLAESEDSEEHKSIKEALMRLSSEDMIETVVDSIAAMPARAKITSLEILTERRAEEHRQIIWDQLNHDSLAVRVAALEALKYFADAAGYDKILSHLLQCSEPVEKKAAQNLAVSIASKMDDIQQQIDPVSNYNKLADIEDKEYLFNILQRIGGKQGLQIILDAIESNNSEITDKAIRTLTNWPDRTAIEPLFQLAGGDFELAYKILAIRGVLRILREQEFDVQRKVDIYARLMSIAERIEEKKLILAGMATIKLPKTLKYIAQYINDNELGGDATQSILAMATDEVTNEKNLRGDEVALALIESWTGENWREKLLAITQDGNTHNQPPEGFAALFNGIDLNGWKGLVANPVKRAQMSHQEMQQAQAESDALMNEHWKVINGVLYFDGGGHSICTANDYADFELFVDWKIERDGDSGIYLRGTPQVQIWDPRENPVGSGGLFNNQTGLNRPLKTADNPVGEWNTYRIIMKGNKVTVYLNDVLVVDDVVMENYWERDKDIYASGPIELQAHNTPLYFRNIFINELEPEEPLVEGALFNGTDLRGWNVINGLEDSWQVKDGILYTEGRGGGWLSTTKEYKDFILELEFLVPPGGNSGVFLRASHKGDPAYSGMEIQVLDDFAPEYKNLKSWQYTGSIYGVEAPAMSASKSANQWQKMEIICTGPEIKVILNGQIIIDTNLIAHMFWEKEHPGLKRRKGYIGLQNHSSKIEYRNIRIKELK